MSGSFCVQEAATLTSQANGLYALFARERSKFEHLLARSDAPDSPGVEELSTALGKQQECVVALKHQLDAIIARLSGLQQAYQSFEENDSIGVDAKYFDTDNERNDIQNRLEVGLSAPKQISIGKPHQTKTFSWDN